MFIDHIITFMKTNSGVVTERKPNKIRIISLRKANLREVQAYETRFKD